MFDVKNSPHREDREFLHKIATPLTVVKAILRNLMMEAQGKKQPVSAEAHLERIEKALEQLTEVEKAHADQKARITRLEKEKIQKSA